MVDTRPLSPDGFAPIADTIGSTCWQKRRHATQPTAEAAASSHNTRASAWSGSAQRQRPRQQCDTLKLWCLHSGQDSKKEWVVAHLVNPDWMVSSARPRGSGAMTPGGDVNDVLWFSSVTVSVGWRVALLSTVGHRGASRV